MPILRKNKVRNYTTIDNTVFYDTELSLKAKGMLCQMLSFKDDWSFSIEGLTTVCKDGKASVMSALNELEEAGYFRRIQLKDGGKFAGVEYVVSETKMSDSPYAENRNAGNWNAENPPQLNTKELNTNKSNTNKDIKASRKRNRNLHNDASLRPTLDEIEAYVSEKNLNVDAKTFLDYFEASEWVDSLGKPVGNWKQKIITWSKNNDDRRSNGKRTGVRSTARKGDRSVGNGEAPEWFKLPPSAPTLLQDD